MSVEADIASLKLIADIYKTPRHANKLYQYTVHKLYSQVPHFEWVGLYLLRKDEYELVASAGDHVSLPTKHHAIIQVTIHSKQNVEIGRLTVTTSEASSQDHTDFISLTVLANEISQRITSVAGNK